MSDRASRLALVIATKDRSEDLKRLLRNLSGQSVLPGEVVIVDASSERDETAAREFPDLRIKYRHHSRPSASEQRNAGLRMTDRDADLIGILDDDIEFEPRALESMLGFWRTAPSEVRGCAFNILNPPREEMRRLKRSRLARWLGLYSGRTGAVTPSGWQTRIGRVAELTFVDWLPSTAVVWRRAVFDNHQFDEFFDGYSYLEDLDFSYSAGRGHKLAILPEAGYRHHHSPSGRVSQFRFGRVEVRNRRYVVRKHGLSRVRCHLGLAIRLLMTLGQAVRRGNSALLRRAAGNVAGLFQPASMRPPARTTRSGRRGGDGHDRTRAPASTAEAGLER